MDENSLYYQELIAAIFRDAGSKVDVNVINFSQDMLSDAGGSLMKVNIKYREGTNPQIREFNLVRRDFRGLKYKGKSVKIENEKFFARHMPHWMATLQFQNLPQTYKIEEKNEALVIFQQYVGDYNLAELYPDLSKDAYDLELSLLDSALTYQPLGVRKDLDELIAHNRVVIQDNKVALKDKYRRFHISPDFKNFLADKKINFLRVYDLIREFHDKATWLWNHNDAFRGLNTAIFDEEKTKAEFSRNLDKLCPRFANTGEKSGIMHMAEKYILPIYLSGNTVVNHGDAIPQNFVFDVRSYSQDLFMTDVANISVINNPLLDIVDYTEYAVNFCGLEQGVVDEMLFKSHKSLVQGDRDLLAITQLYRNIDALSALVGRVHQAEEGRFMASQYLGMYNRVGAYVNRLDDMVCQLPQRIEDKNKREGIKYFLEDFKINYLDSPEVRSFQAQSYLA